MDGKNCLCKSEFSQGNEEAVFDVSCAEVGAASVVNTVVSEDISQKTNSLLISCQLGKRTLAVLEEGSGTEELANKKAKSSRKGKNKMVKAENDDTICEESYEQDEDIINRSSRTVCLLSLKQLEIPKDDNLIRPIRSDHVAYFLSAMKSGNFRRETTVISVASAKDVQLVDTDSKVLVLDGCHRVSAAKTFNELVSKERRIDELPCRIFFGISIADKPKFISLVRAVQRVYLPLDTCDVITLFRKQVARDRLSGDKNFNSSRESWRKILQPYCLPCWDVVRSVIYLSDSFWVQVAEPIMKSFRSCCINFSSKGDVQLPAKKLPLGGRFNGRRDLHYYPFWRVILNLFKRDPKKCIAVVQDLLDRKLSVEDVMKLYESHLEEIAVYLERKLDIRCSSTEEMMLKMFGTVHVDDATTVFHEILRMNRGLRRCRTENFFARFRDAFEKRAGATVVMDDSGALSLDTKATMVVVDNVKESAVLLKQFLSDFSGTIFILFLNVHVDDVVESIGISRTETAEIILYSDPPTTISGFVIPNNYRPMSVALVECPTCLARPLSEVVEAYRKKDCVVASALPDHPNTFWSLAVPFAKPDHDIIYVGRGKDGTVWIQVARRLYMNFRTLQRSSESVDTGVRDTEDDVKKVTYCRKYNFSGTFESFMPSVS